MSRKNTLVPLIDEGVLFPGDLLVSVIGKRVSYPGLAEITKDGEMRILYPADLHERIKIHDTPSSAGRAIRRGKSCNGWTEWAVVRIKRWPPAPIPRDIYFGDEISNYKLETILLATLRQECNALRKERGLASIGPPETRMPRRT